MSMSIREKMNAIRPPHSQEYRDALDRKTRRVMLGVLVSVTAGFLIEVGVIIWVVLTR